MSWDLIENGQNPAATGFFSGENMSRYKEQLQSGEGPIIIDAILREGVQAPDIFDSRKYYLRTEDKVAITKALIVVGIPMIEVFSPIVSPREAEDLQAVIEARNQMVKEGRQYTYILAHVRCDSKDATEALKAGVDGLNFYIGTSPQSQNHKFSQPRDIHKITRTALDVIKNIREDNSDIPIRFSGEDGFRTPMNQLKIPYQAVAPYVNRFGTPDTVGIATPAMVRRRISDLQKEFPNHEFEGHFHDDDLRAVDNAEAAFMSGVRYVQTTPNGLGERKGITDMGSFFYRIYKRDPKLLAKYDISQVYALNALVADITRTRVSGIINSYNRTHSAGVHTGAVLRNSGTYEGNPDLEKFGVNQTKLLIGPLSGWHIIDYTLREFLDFPHVTEDQSRQVTEEFKATVHEALEMDSNIRPMDVLKGIAIQQGLYYSPKEKTQRELILE